LIISDYSFSFLLSLSLFIFISNLSFSPKKEKKKKKRRERVAISFESIVKLTIIRARNVCDIIKNKKKSKFLRYKARVFLKNNIFKKKN